MGAAPTYTWKGGRGMARKLKARSSLAICEDIITVLEKADPHFYWPEEHDKNVKEAEDYLCGRRLVMPKTYLTSIRKKAVEAGRGEEIQPLITEARRYLKLQEQPKEKQPRRSDPGR